jgi:hypothetical protein
MITNDILDSVVKYYKDIKNVIDNLLLAEIDYYKSEATHKLVLTKAGAEKFLHLINTKGVSYSLISNNDNVYIIKATIEENSGRLGESYGIATIQEFENHNTTIKLAQKRALVGAVINFFGMSEFFTQDLDDTKEVKSTTKRELSPHFIYTQTKINEADSVDQIQKIKEKLPLWKVLSEEEKNELLFLADLKEQSLTHDNRQ